MQTQTVSLNKNLPEALDMVRKLHLLASSQHPDLHQLVSELEAKLTDIYLDS